MADSAPPPRSSLPRQISRYRIVGRLGRGAMGVVYSAVDEVMDRPVALKVLIADLETDPDTRARFYREAQAAARLLHPNVITVYDAGEDQGRSFIAMQLLEGAPLSAHLQRPGCSSLERKLDLMIQVCEGLAAAHAEGIIHRDLKPSNLFVQSDGLLKILDFGVARVTDSSMTAAGTMLGTPDYMSPEQARGAPVDIRSDIFSAGAVFYFMLAGRKPFPGPDLPAILHQLQMEEPAALRGIPPELMTLISRTMSKRPDHRPDRVEQVLADLVRFRRQYQADTRRLAFALRTQFEELEAVAASAHDADAALGVEGDGDRLAALRAQYPFLAIRGTSLDFVPSERGDLAAVTKVLQDQREHLGQLLDARQACLRRLGEGEQALASGDAIAALGLFESALADCSGSARARKLVDTVRPLAAEQRHRRERVVHLVAKARESFSRGDINHAEVCCRDALALDPAADAATSLLREAEQAIAREHERIARRLQEVLDRAAAATEEQAFDDADAALAEAETIQPDSPALIAARQRLAQERAAVAAAESLREASADEVRRARAAFRRGQEDEALQRLETFVGRHPGAESAVEELEYLRSLRSAMAESQETSDAHVQELLARAAAARDHGAFDDAHGALRDALHWDPTSAAAAAMLDDVLGRQLEARIAQERVRMREQRLAVGALVVTAARDAMQRGYVDIALQAALAAQRIAPDTVGLGAMIQDCRRELAGDDDETFELAAPPTADADNVPSAARHVHAADSVFGWAAELFRTGLRRRKT
jgi:tetratricopeptide (TPR) repeat protein